MTQQCFDNSVSLFGQGKEIFPSGVNSPGRMFSEVDTPALVIDSASGARIRDVDGNEFIDFMMGLGPCILGHAPPPVVEAVQRQILRGSVYGANSRLELALGKRIVEAVGPVERLRFTCSGTEAVMSALRVARAHTSRPTILKFRGGYHGHSDVALAQATKKAIRQNMRKVRDGLHTAIDRNTVVVDYNDVQSVERVFAEKAGELGAVILEPIATNMGLVPPTGEFLGTLRKLCDRHNVVLIFDEVVTGFRLCFGSVCELLDVVPDMVIFGKIIGGGLPIGAYGGRADIMSQVGEKGGVFQGGTFAGSPLTMAAGLATLDVLAEDGFYEQFELLAERFVSVTRRGFAKQGVPFAIDRFGALVSYIFIEGLERLESFACVERQDTELYHAFHREMAVRGYLLPPTIEEPLFLSSAHRVEEVEAAAADAVEVIAGLHNAKTKAASAKATYAVVA